jgi:hypothetical protein
MELEAMSDGNAEKVAPTTKPKPAPPAYDELLDALFTYHKPDEYQIAHYAAVREKAREMAQVIHDSCPPSADRTAAMRQLQDTVMTANRAIALQGRSYR